MPLPVFDKKDDIPKGFEDEYEERGGKWHPKDAAAEIRETLRKERDLRDQAEKDRKKLEKERADLERQLAAATSGEEKEKGSKLLKKFDEDRERMEREHKEAMGKLEAELRTLKLDDRVKVVALAAGVIPERVDAVLKLTKERFDLDGDRIVVKSEKGEVTTEKVEDFFAKTYKGQMPELYSGTKAAGGGAGGGAGNKGGKPGKMTPDEIVEDPLKGLQAANAEGSQ